MNHFYNERTETERSVSLQDTYGGAVSPTSSSSAHQRFDPLTDDLFAIAEKNLRDLEAIKNRHRLRSSPGAGVDTKIERMAQARRPVLNPPSSTVAMSSTSSTTTYNYTSSPSSSSPSSSTAATATFLTRYSIGGDRGTTGNILGNVSGSDSNFYSNSNSNMSGDSQNRVKDWLGLEKTSHDIVDDILNKYSTHSKGGMINYRRTADSTNFLSRYNIYSGGEGGPSSTFLRPSTALSSASSDASFQQQQQQQQYSSFIDHPNIQQSNSSPLSQSSPYTNHIQSVGRSSPGRSTTSSSSVAVKNKIDSLLSNATHFNSTKNSKYSHIYNNNNNSNDKNDDDNNYYNNNNNNNNNNFNNRINSSSSSSSSGDSPSSRLDMTISMLLQKNQDLTEVVEKQKEDLKNANEQNDKYCISIKEKDDERQCFLGQIEILRQQLIEKTLEADGYVEQLNAGVLSERSLLVERIDSGPGQVRVDVSEYNDNVDNNDDNDDKSDSNVDTDTLQGDNIEGFANNKPTTATLNIDEITENKNTMDAMESNDSDNDVDGDEDGEVEVENSILREEEGVASPDVGRLMAAVAAYRNKLARYKAERSAILQHIAQYADKIDQLEALATSQNRKTLKYYEYKRVIGVILLSHHRKVVKLKCFSVLKTLFKDGKIKKAALSNQSSLTNVSFDSMARLLDGSVSSTAMHPLVASRNQEVPSYVHMYNGSMLVSLDPTTRPADVRRNSAVGLTLLAFLQLIVWALVVLGFYFAVTTSTLTSETSTPYALSSDML